MIEPNLRISSRPRFAVNLKFFVLKNLNNESQKSRLILRFLKNFCIPKEISPNLVHLIISILKSLPAFFFLRQVDVCGSALSEVIPAVLEGSDGCLLAIGYPGAGDENFRSRLNDFQLNFNFKRFLTHDLSFLRNNTSILPWHSFHKLYSSIT